MSIRFRVFLRLPVFRRWRHAVRLGPRLPPRDCIQPTRIISVADPPEGDHFTGHGFYGCTVLEAINFATRLFVMTARPDRFKREASVDLPYPRDVTSDPFHEYEKLVYCYGDLDEELAKSFATSAEAD